MKARSAREQPGESGWYAISPLAQTTLRSVLREVALDDLLSRRETLNAKLQTILDQHTDSWGIKVALVEVKQVELPQEMQRAMSKLAEATAVAAKQPVAIQLQYLQTLDRRSELKRTRRLSFPSPWIFFKDSSSDRGDNGAGVLDPKRR